MSSTIPALEMVVLRTNLLLHYCVPINPSAIKGPESIKSCDSHHWCYTFGLGSPHEKKDEREVAINDSTLRALGFIAIL